MSATRPLEALSRLEGWKQIADYLGVKEGTAQRWERDLGLPVHREERQKRSAVFAFPAELDAWRQGLHTPPDSPPTVRPTLRRFPWRHVLLIVMGVVALAVLGTIIFRIRGHKVETAGPSQFGRLFVRSTSEGKSPTTIHLTDQPTRRRNFLAISPDGDRLFAAPNSGRTLSIVNTATHAAHTLDLPHDVSCLAASSNRRLYVGSINEGLTVVDIAAERLLPGTIAVGGPIWQMAITPDGEKVFLAMEQSGVRRLMTRTGKLEQISDRICPKNLAMDRQGKYLYVAYQCSGPGGRPGHDSVEIFDVETEASVGVFSGPPMVGADISVSPDGKLVLLDEADACSAPQYDHAGCATVPSHVMQLFRPYDRRVLNTFSYPRAFWNGGFLDNSRFLILGDWLRVIDASKYTEVESFNLSKVLNPAVFDLVRGRVFVDEPESNSILVIEAESPACSPSATGLAMSYPADGAYDDVAGLTTLVAHGRMRFVPGKVGQAFFFEGGSYLSETWQGEWQGNYAFGRQESTVSLYVKLASIDDEMVLLDWASHEPRAGITLFKSADDRFVFKSWPGDRVVASSTKVKANTWYHLAVTKGDGEITLDVNGEPQARSPSSPRVPGKPPSLFLGARSPGQPAFHGWLDEIAFYGRALTADEVKALYQLRESGPCKL